MEMGDRQRDGRQEDRKTERQKDRKTERKTERKGDQTGRHEDRRHEDTDRRCGEGATSRTPPTFVMSEIPNIFICRITRQRVI